MATDLTPELLQNIAIRVVAQFMTKQACLSASIASEAKTLELNPEQIKRVIETTNTIAYLRQLEDAKDRSFEFPIAEYRDVMGRMVLPDGSPTVNNIVEPLALPLAEKIEVTKSAEVKTGPLNKKAPVSQINSSITDSAEYDQEQEKVAMLVKETLRVKQTLQKLAEEGYMVSMRLEKLASILQKDPQGFEKLSHIASEEDLGSLTVLCGFEKTAETSSVFTNSELADAISLNSLFKEAKDLITSQNEMEVFVKRATDILIEKNAFSPIGAAVEGIGKGLGFATRKLGAGAVGAVKKVGVGLGALTAGKTIGQRLERAGDVAGAALAGTTMTHDTPVWKSIHG